MLRSQSFIFDGQSSDEYGVMLYFLDDDTPIREINLGTNINIVEDRPARRTTPIHYGVNLNQPLSFPIVFGSTEYLNDYEVDAILGWLTGHNKYKDLEYVDQGHYVKYKCFINDISTVFVNGLPTAFKGTVVCDGQFAYEYPIEYVYDIDETPSKISLFNRSSYNGYYYPNLEITFDNDCECLYLTNASDDDRTTQLNYIDRHSASENEETFSYETTINNEFSQKVNMLENFSWDATTIPTGSYNDIIFKNGRYILLPYKNNIIQISDDEGKTWTQKILPESGTFIGCAGKDGYVAIKTNEISATVLYSSNGEDWEKASTSSELPLQQNWRSICYAELENFADGYYIAVGDGSTAAASLTGMNWKSLNISLPGAGWDKVTYGDGKAIAISSNGGQLAYCTNVTTWHLIDLPTKAKWTDIVYGEHGWCLVCNSMATKPQKAINLYSKDGIVWEERVMPIGGWTQLVYCNGCYLALAGMTYALSKDNENWVVSSYEKNIIRISHNTKKIIGFTDNALLHSSLLNSIVGSFEFTLPLNSSIAAINISAQISNINDLHSDFLSNGLQTLHLKNGEDEMNYGYVTLTQDLRNGLNAEGVRAKAEWDEESRKVTITYTCDPNQTSVMDAQFIINASYHYRVNVDADGMDDLCIKINNKNQIITSNRTDLNLYPYFNNTFFRLLKGNNNLVMATTGGKAKVKIICEFLRKAGGF